MKEDLKSGRLAIRLLYFFIISMALTRSTAILFTNANNQFAFPSIDNFFLFVIFLSIIIRFCLGGYRILTEDIEIEYRRWKIITDSIFLIIQALIFYVYSLTYNSFIYSIWLIFAICGIDLIWIEISRIKFQVKTKTFAQWIIHDIIFLFLAPSVSLFIIHYISGILIIICLFILAMLLFITDFSTSMDFYFAHTSSGLRIFIAGPYGDQLDKKVITKNVNKAKDIGKEITLKGHYPFIPHTMLHGWETDNRFTSDNFKQIDLQWLEFCDALYFIAPSPGANAEKAFAESKGLKIFYSLDEVPDVKNVK